MDQLMVWGRSYLRTSFDGYGSHRECELSFFRTMEAPRYEYRRLELESPPSEELLADAVDKGWRFVGVTASGDRFLAYFERPRLGELSPTEQTLTSATAPSLFKALHGRMTGMLESHTGSPELESLADGLDRLNRVFLEMLRDQLDSEEIERLAAADPGLAEMLADRAAHLSAASAAASPAAQLLSAGFSVGFVPAALHQQELERPVPELDSVDHDGRTGQIQNQALFPDPLLLVKPGTNPHHKRRVHR